MGDRRCLAPGAFVWLTWLLLAPAACGDEPLPWHAQRAEEARELALFDDVEVVRMTREEFAAQAADRADTISDEYLRYYADTYGRLGYFDRTLDLRPIFAGSSSDWVGATYAPSRKQITLVGEARDDTIVHEYVHALQDQHFDLRAYDVLDTSDGFLARRAVVEGDAVLAEYRFVQQQMGLDLDAVDWPALMTAWRDFADRQLAEADYPLVFLDYVSFVYTYGLEYTAANLTSVSIDQPERLVPTPHDWERQDALFTQHPPSSTYQVLRRDLDGEDSMPPIGLDTVPADLGDRLQSLDWDILGTWYVYLLLYPLQADGAVADARALADAWRGDRALFVRDLDGDQVGTLWASAWADETAAQSMEAALWLLHGGAQPGDGASSGTAGDGEPLWIERRGARVVAARNVSADLAPALADAAFGAPTSPALRRRPSLAAISARLRSGWRCGYGL